MKYLILTCLHLSLLTMSTAGLSKVQPQQQVPRTSDIMKEERSMPGTNVDLEEMNTSPNPVDPENGSSGSVIVPQKQEEEQRPMNNNHEKLEEQQDHIPQRRPVIEDGTVPDGTDKYEETQAMKG